MSSILLLDKRVQLGSTAAEICVIVDPRYDGTSASGYFELPFIFTGDDEPDQEADGLGRIRIMFNPSSLMSEAGRADILSTLVHELAEYSAAAHDAVVVPAFQRPKYSCVRRTLVMDHNTTFCDVCDEVGDVLSQVWPELVKIFALTPLRVKKLLAPKPKQEKKKNVPKRKTRKTTKS